MYLVHAFDITTGIKAMCLLHLAMQSIDRGRYLVVTLIGINAQTAKSEGNNAKEGIL